MSSMPKREQHAKTQVASSMSKPNRMLKHEGYTVTPTCHNKNNPA